MVAIECKAWAKNIVHDSQDRKGLVHFEVNISINFNFCKK